MVVQFGYATIGPDKEVFRHNEIGSDYFYVLVQGEVVIKKPNPAYRSLVNRK
jgi:hypothetical protein